MMCNSVDEAIDSAHVSDAAIWASAGELRSRLFQGMCRIVQFRNGLSGYCKFLAALP